MYAGKNYIVIYYPGPLKTTSHALSSLYLALTSVLSPVRDQLLLHIVSQTDGFASHLLVVSFSSPLPTHQPTPAGLCHVPIYGISPESTSELLGILIKYAPLCLSFRTAYSFDLRLVSTVASVKVYEGMSYMYTDLL